MTALTPILWGTTYIVTTELLPPDRPLLAALLRALPAGLLLLAITRHLPRGVWWWRAAVLGALNISVFFALLFVAAYRLPGGVAATIQALQPLMVIGLSAALLSERLTVRATTAAAAGVVGVGLLVLQADARLDPIGVVAAVGCTAAMATGVVLSKRWTPPASLLATTGWQLTAGGLLLLPVALTVEGPPPTLTATNLAGYGYLTLLGTALAYVLWFRGIRELSPTSVTFLVLLSPLTATALGWLLLEERLTPVQALGALIVLAAIVAAQVRLTRRTAPRRDTGDRSGGSDSPASAVPREAPAPPAPAPRS